MIIINKYILKSIKGNLPLILFCFIVINANAQQYYIVPNPSFENYIKCPSVYENSQIANWYMVTNAASYYINSCDNINCTGVPHNCGGATSSNYQYPRTGNSYIVNAFHITFNVYPTWKRTYQQVKLTQPLQAGHCYYAGYYINLCNGQDMACNNAGLLFTNNPIYVDTLATPFGVLNATPQILNYGNPIIKDTLNWVKVSGVYVANGGEEYITLGNFFNDVNTIIDSFKTKPIKHIVYNIDDVFVIPLDSMPLKADAGKDTSIANIGDSVFIGSLTNGLTSVKWFDANGNEITSKAGVPGFYAEPTASTFYVIEQTVCGYYSRDTVNVTVGTVPLKFISLTLNPSPKGDGLETQIIWQTANEVNVSHFNVQRSLNGKDFINVGKVSANNKSYSEYHFTDGVSAPSPLGEGWREAFYRIESVDKDGRKQYSETRTLNYKPQTLNSVSIYPNPAKDVVNIECKGAREQLIIDYLGRTVYKTMVNGQWTMVNTKQFPKGIYVVKAIMNNGDIKTEKLVLE